MDYLRRTHKLAGICGGGDLGVPTVAPANKAE